MKLDVTESLFLEFQSVSQYLLGDLPEAWMRQNLAQYARGLQFHIGNDAGASNSDVQKWNWSKEDARESRKRDPHSPVRLRLILAHAIWETDPRTAHFYLPMNLGPFQLMWVLLRFGVRGVWRRLCHFL